MNWKESKLVGMVAFVLMIGALAVIVLFAKSQMRQGKQAYYLCASTGDTFSVLVDPSNQEYLDTYIVEYGNTVPCKICGQEDAVQAYRHPEGKWVKYGWTYLMCESTGTVFDTPASETVEGYNPQYAKGPGIACLCKICGEEDAYEVTLDEKGNWIRSTAAEEPSGEVERELPEPSPEEIGGIDGFILRQEAKEAREAKEAAEREKGDAQAIEGDEGDRISPPAQDQRQPEEGAAETSTDEAASERSAEETESTATQ